MKTRLTGVHEDLKALEGVCAKLRDGDDRMLNVYHTELRKVEERSSLTLTTVVDVLRELRQDDAKLPALETLVRGNIGSALLLRNHLASHAARLENLPSVRARLAAASGQTGTGAANVATRLIDCVQDAGHEATMLADHASLEGAPRLELQGFDSDPSVAAVPHHVSHCILELLKNSFKAHVDAGRTDVPVVVRHRAAHGAVCLDVVDFGRGIPGGTRAFEALARLRPGARYDRVHEQTTYAKVDDPLGGFGVGLCVARLHAEHFMGSGLLLSSNDTGSSATLVLVDDAHAIERLPDVDRAIADLDTST